MDKRKLFSKLQGKKILVIGGTGFIGSNLLVGLLGVGAKPTSFSRRRKKPIRGASYRVGNVNKFADIAAVIEDKFDYIFYCAGNSDRLSHDDFIDSGLLDNQGGVLNVLKAIVKSGNRSKLIFVSSRLEYGKPRYLPVDEKHPLEPLDFYAISKLASTLTILAFAQAYQIPSVVLRVSNVYGPHPQFNYQNYNIINHFLDKALQGQELIIYGEGKQLRDYLYIDDLVEALLLAAVSDQTDREIYNIGLGEAISFRDFVAIIAKNTDVKVSHVNWPELQLLTETGDYYSDIGKIGRHLSWKPRIFPEEGVVLSLKRLSAHFRKKG